MRVKNALKQEELAKIIHVSQSSLSCYENERYEPDKKTLLKLSQFFSVSTDYLLGADENNNTINSPLKRIPVYKLSCSEKKTSKHLLYDLEISSHQVPDGEYFGLQMCGDSMAPRIFPGDLIIARRQSSAENGDIVVVEINGNNATVKKVIRYDGGVTLLPFNPMYSPVSYTNKEILNLPVVIIGKAIEIRGKC